MNLETLRAKGVGRMKEVGVLAFAALCVVAAFWPERAGVVLWKALLLLLGGYAGYWGDRMAYRADRRPHLLLGPERSHAEYRRAIIIAAAVLSVALSL